MAHAAELSEEEDVYKAVRSTIVGDSTTELFSGELECQWSALVGRTDKFKSEAMKGKEELAKDTGHHVTPCGHVSVNGP